MSIKTIWSMKAASLNMARPNRYEVEIIPPSALDLTNQKDLRKITLNCNSAEIPSRILGVVESRTGGPLRRLPYDRIYNPINIGFYADAELQEWNFFNTWMDLISEKQVPAWIDNPELLEQEGGAEQLEKSRFFEYYNDYIGQVTVGQLNMLSTQTRLVTMTECYPVNLSALTYSYENGDQVQTFTVSMQFREFTVESGIFSVANLTENIPGRVINTVKQSLGNANPGQTLF